MALVTLAQVKTHLRVTATDSDADLDQKRAAAEAHVVTWCSSTPRAKAVASAWTSANLPPAVLAAILVQTGELDQFRGDDANGVPRQTGEELSVAVRELLRAYHDPVIA